MTTLNSKQYKEEERKSWDSVANNLQKWWKIIEKGAEKVSKRLIELADIAPDSRVLDIATGIGEPSIMAANLVGKSGHVLATDISPQMLSFAKQRSISLGLQDVIEFKEGDAETIELTPLTFDAALCRLGLMFLPNLNAGLSNIYRSLVNGGRFAAAVWALPAQDTLIATTMNIIMKETNSKPPPPGTPGPFSLSDENKLRNSFLVSGFKDPSIERMTVSFDFDSPDKFSTFTSETAGPLQKILANQTYEKRKEILKSISKAAERYVDNTTGEVSFKDDAILIVGKK